MVEWRHTYGRKITAAALDALEGYPQCELVSRGIRPQGMSQQAWETIERADLDGIIADMDTPERVDCLAKLGLTVVDVADSHHHEHFARVHTDNDALGQMAADYLTELPVEHFAFVGYENQNYSLTRFSGFRKRLLKLGKSSLHDFHLPVAAFIETEDLTEHFLNWLKALPLPCAIFCVHDLLACRIWDICRENNLNVPGDISILGVDNEASAQEIFRNGLSTIEQDLEGIGREAVRVLMHLLRTGEPPHTQQKLIPPGRLLRRASTERLREDTLVAKAQKVIREQACLGLRVSDLANQLHVSRRTLERRFREQTSHSILDAISHRKLERAKDLLNNTQLSIQQIALELGYEEQRDLTRLFQRLMQTTPSQFRESRRK